MRMHFFTDFCVIDSIGTLACCFLLLFNNIFFCHSLKNRKKSYNWIIVELVIYQKLYVCSNIFYVRTQINLRLISD